MFEVLYEKKWQNGHFQLETLVHEGSVDRAKIVNGLRRTVQISSGASAVKAIVPFRFLPREFEADFCSQEVERTEIPPKKEAVSLTDKILSIFLNTNIRKGKLELIQPYMEIFRQRIQDFINANEPITIVLPSMPFKDQTPLTTRHSLGAVDLGEYLVMAQMRTIIESIEAIYPNGAQIILLTDGLVYSDLFARGERDGAERYRLSCQKARDDMGLRGKVSLVDMEWVVNQESGFNESRQRTRDLLESLYDEDTVVKESIDCLARCMFMNVPVGSYSYNDYAAMSSLPLSNLPDSMQQQFHAVAVDYSAFLLTMKSLEVIERAFPRALRATVHPKDAPQLPVHLVNQKSAVLPYNGVPIVSERRLDATRSIRRSTRIVRFSEVLNYPDARAVYRGVNGGAFYYLV